MVDTIIGWFSSITGNDYLTLYLISIIPIIELRGAIVFMSGMFTSIEEMMIGMCCCIAGSTTIIVPVILITRPLLRKLRHTKLFAKLAKNMESTIADRATSAYNAEEEAKKEALRVDGKKEKKPLSVDAKKFLGLFVFVAIPLPVTGAWTGSCVGSFLDFKLWKATLAIFLGNIVAGLILTSIAYFLPEQYSDLFLYGFVILAVILAVYFSYTRTKKNQKKLAEAKAAYSDIDSYKFAVLKEEAEEEGKVLIKKEYVDENGDKHIVIGKDSSKNEEALNSDDLI